ncbi:MAG: hypothetical protein ACYTGL_01455 [Planctomycetota bacterium]|jgi:hypothetical protein
MTARFVFWTSAELMRRLLFLPAFLLTLLSVLPGCAVVEVGVRNPVPGLETVAVVPFFNLSQERMVDGREFALAYYAELQKVPGFEVIPVGVAERAMLENGLTMESPGDALHLARILGVDAVVVGAVTDYDPYSPRVGLKVAWYSPKQWLFLPNAPEKGISLTAAVDQSDKIIVRAQSPTQADVATDVPVIEEGDWETVTTPAEPSTLGDIADDAEFLPPRPGLSTSELTFSKPIVTQQPISRVTPDAAGTRDRSADTSPRASGTPSTAAVTAPAPRSAQRDAFTPDLAARALQPRRPVWIAQNGAAAGTPSTTASPGLPTLPPVGGPTAPADQTQTPSAAAMQGTPPTPLFGPSSQPIGSTAEPDRSTMSPPMAITEEEDTVPALVFDDQIILGKADFDPHEPLMAYVRMFDSTDARLVARLADYLELSGETRSGDLEAYMKRSDFFRKFTAHVMISEMLMLHGGESRRRFVLRQRRYE